MSETDTMPALADGVEQKTLSKEYRFSESSGKEALRNEALIGKLAETWAVSYRQSPERAQSGNPLYADRPEAREERIKTIKKELGVESARLVYVECDGQVVGFFWGMGIADLEKISPEKAEHVKSHLDGLPEKAAYLSMLGVVNEIDGVKHTGNKLGQRLTTKLCEMFKKDGFAEAIARTINEQALNAVYKPLVFEIKSQFFDKKDKTTRYVFSKLL